MDNLVLRKEIRRARVETWKHFYEADLVWGRRVPQAYLERFTSLCKQRKVEQIVDAGCGSGLYSIYFSLKGFRVVALDISRTGLALAKHLVRSLHFLRLARAISLEPSTVDFVNVELPHFPLVNNSAEAILVNYTLHQLTHEELAECITAFKKTLKDRGVLLIHEPCGDVALASPNETTDILKDGSLFLRKQRVVNWNLTRDQLSEMMKVNFNVLNEERLEEDGKPKVIFILERV